MANVVALFKEALPADYVEIAPGVFALSWDNVRLSPGTLCNDPILGAAEFNRHLKNRTIHPNIEIEMAKIRDLLSHCFSHDGLFPILLAAAFKNSIDPRIVLPSSFSIHLATLPLDQKNSIYYVLNSSHLTKSALDIVQVTRLFELKILLM